MRTLVSFLVGILTAAVIVGLGFLVADNGQDEQLSMLGTTFQGEKGWIVAGAAALGFLLAFLLLIPGRMASAWNNLALGQQAHALSARLQALREQYAELQGRHQHLLAEHQQVMAHVLTPVAGGRGQSSSTVSTAANGSAIPAARQPAPQTRLVRQDDAPLDRLQIRIAAMRARLKRASARRNASDQEQLPQSPTAASA